AGMKNDCDLGDVIVADPSWDYGSGKYIRKDGSPEFLLAPYQINLNRSLQSKLFLMSQDQQTLDEIRRQWQGKPPKSVLRMHLGPVGSGGAVLADSVVCESVRVQHRKVIGIDMETYGVLAAAEESPAPQPKAFSIKSACDFADEQKNDDYREY